MLRRNFLTLIGAGLSCHPSFAGAASSSSIEASSSPHRIAAQIRTEFIHAWQGYRNVAWGSDEFGPLSGKGHDFFIPGHSFGLSIIEALDTLYVMELDEELRDCVQWLRKHLSFDIDGDVQTFEAVIRMVGGLIAGYYATGEPALLGAARGLADRLLPAFTKSPSGVPYRFVNLRTGTVSGSVTNLAEAGSNILEFGELSRLTGNPKYFAVAKQAYRAVIRQRSYIDLLGSEFDVERGKFVATDSGAPNPPDDSFYEYLYGAWRMFGDADARDWYRLLTDAILKRQQVLIGSELWFAQVDQRTGARTEHQTQSELGAFYAELLAKGGDRSIGERYFDSWTVIAEKYGLIPEQIDYRDHSIIDPAYLLRPEYANSAFDLWFLTGSQKYRKTAYAHFRALRTHCRVAGGYATISDVRTSPMARGDLFPSYSFSENFKYLYMTFADAPRFNGKNYYLSTEGKILRGLLPRTEAPRQ